MIPFALKVALKISLVIFIQSLILIRRLITTILYNRQKLKSTKFIPPVNKKFQTKFIHSELESLNWLHAESPCFPVRADNVTILHEPKEFYNVLIDKCGTAKKRIILTSLYFGTETLEQELVKTIHENLRNNSNLDINVLLDYGRDTRGIPNAQTCFQKLIQEENNFCLSLYHTPAIRGMTKRFSPPRYNELVGVQHMKIYLFDDTVIISGANLSKDYFTNRQDRYIMVEDKNLADFYFGFLNKVQEFSLKVNKNGDIGLHPNWKQLPYANSKEDFIFEAKQRIYDFFTETMDRQRLIVEQQSTNDDTWIFPLIEMGQLDIHHDSLITNYLLASSLEGSKIKFATGYFNLTDVYMNTITNECKAECSILMGHPSMNGWAGAKGPAGSIPTAYSLLARNFYEIVKKANQLNRIKLIEYVKTDWSYHAKGIWYYLPDSDLPNLTLIGSSNFGERSVNRDLESQMCLVTLNGKLQKRLQLECDRLYDHGRSAEDDLIKRNVPRWIKSVVCVFKAFF